MRYVVSTNGHILKTYKTEGSARAAVTRKWSKRYPNAVVHDYETFQRDINKLVEVRNLMSGKMVSIRLSEVGGPCDPSTELYWTM